MQWKYVEPLKSIELIDDFERLMGYTFCESFRQFVIEHNGGTPSKFIFDTNIEKERVVNSFLSFNHEDSETIWDAVDPKVENLIDGYIPFATDPFGNNICFDVDDDSVVFLDHETLNVEFIADSFDAFLDKLYDESDILDLN